MHGATVKIIQICSVALVASYKIFRTAVVINICEALWVCVCILTLVIRMKIAYFLRRITLWPVTCLYHTLPRYLINGRIFGKQKLLNMKCVVWLSLQILSDIFLFLRVIQRDIIISAHVKTHYSCQNIIKLEFSQLISRKFSNIEFHGNLSSGRRVVAWRQNDGWTDRHDKANNHFSKFCERA
jgi:hypothetical protein